MKWFTFHHIRLAWFVSVTLMNASLFVHEFLKGK